MGGNWNAEIRSSLGEDGGAITGPKLPRHDEKERHICSDTGEFLHWPITEACSILYSSFQSWFSVNSNLMNTSFFFFFFLASCIHIPSKITLPCWGILVCECRDLIHFRMKWASSCLSVLCSYERLLQGLWLSNKNSSCIFIGSGPVSRTQHTRVHTLGSLVQARNTLTHTQPF